MKICSLSCTLLLFVSLMVFSCRKSTTPTPPPEDAVTMNEIGSIDLGDLGAAEIAAYDPLTQRLFVVNNSSPTASKIDVLDISKPEKPVFLQAIDVSRYGGFVNSVDVYDGMLAAAIEGAVKTNNGKVVIFKTSDYTEVKVIDVGALPDMITYSPDGKFILTANEGEPNDDYSVDPLGSVSIISVPEYTVKTVDFSVFASQQTALQAQGLRIFGINTSFARDLEPEYITVSKDSKTAWVTFQENNAIGVIDLTTQTPIRIFPLGFKHYGLDNNRMDLSDRDNVIAFNRTWNVKGIFQPDAIAVVHSNVPLIITANEGDAREYAALNEVRRVRDLTLDPVIFPNASVLRQDANLGRLNVTTRLGDTDGDGDFDELFSFGARSFSIWNGLNGALVYDSKNELDQAAASARLYDDNRSDDKGTEPEGLTVGQVGERTVLFIGLERADAIVMYDITNPYNPVFMRIIPSGDAPEGVLFIPAAKSPNGKSLLVVSSENDGTVKIYSTK
ncbi:MAG: choice-of-anchor I family protein [Chitinophagaceae bacterium]|nr:choice-of-anchor I family protein [Chitinophagaceae bacterium]